MSKKAHGNNQPYKSPKHFLKQKRDLQSAYQQEFAQPPRGFLNVRDKPYPEKVWKNIKYSYDPEIIQTSTQVTYRGHGHQEMTQSFAQKFRNTNLNEYDYNRGKILESQNTQPSIFKSDYKAYNKDSFRKKTVYPENRHKQLNLRYDKDTIQSNYAKDYKNYKIVGERPKTASQSLYEPKSFGSPYQSPSNKLESQKKEIDTVLQDFAKQNKPAYMRQIIKSRYPSEVVSPTKFDVHRMEKFGVRHDETPEIGKKTRQFTCQSEYQTTFKKLNTEPSTFPKYHLQYKSIDAPFTCKSSYAEQFKNYGKVERTKKIVFKTDDDSD